MDSIKLEKLDVKKHKADIKYINKHMRAADRTELEAFGYVDLYTAIQTSIKVANESYIAFNNGTALCVFGLSCVQVGHGHAIWCIASEELDKHAKAFLYYSHEVITYWLKTHPSLYNYVSIKNKRAIRWLKSIGATFSEVVNINNEPFKMFVIRKEV